jgi:hypothetical protein
MPRHPKHKIKYLRKRVVLLEINNNDFFENWQFDHYLKYQNSIPSTIWQASLGLNLGEKCV